MVDKSYISSIVACVSSCKETGDCSNRGLPSSLVDQQNDCLSCQVNLVTSEPHNSLMKGTVMRVDPFQYIGYHAILINLCICPI